MKAWTLAVSLFSVALAGTLLTPACSPTVHDPLACQDGSCAHQSELTFCDIDGAYADYKNECIAPPSDNACNRVVGCPQATPHCTDESDGVCVECRDSNDCTDNTKPNCDLRDNTCTADEVVLCEQGALGDAACLAEAAGKDYCGPAGVCVGCLDNDHCMGVAEGEICSETPLFECRGCEQNSECDSDLCGTKDEGECVAVTDVIYAAAAGMTAGECDTTANACTITYALTKVDATRNVLLLQAGTYNERVILDGGDPVWMSGEGMVTIGQPSGGTATQNALSVINGADVTLIAVTISDASGNPNSNAVQCNGSTLRLIESTVANARRTGIVADDCTLSVLQSTVSQNTGGGIAVNGSTYSITNNVIVANGADGVAGSAKGGVLLAGANAGIFEFNTLSGNGVINGALLGSGLTCSGVTVPMSNNIIVSGGQGGGQGLVFGNCTHTYSLVEGGDTSMGNITGDPLFIDPGLGNYHLQTGASGSPCIDAADPAATLAIDIDGDIRPLIVGGTRDMGADEAE